jgi:DNA invertase Pin-like site-specific DNA recombinase
MVGSLPLAELVQRSCRACGSGFLRSAHGECCSGRCVGYLAAGYPDKASQARLDDPFADHVWTSAQQETDREGGVCAGFDAGAAGRLRSSEATARRFELGPIAGDTRQLLAEQLLATHGDRLARSVRDLVEIIERIRAKGAAIEIGNLGRVNGSPTSGLILNVLGAIAQFEREMMLERQRDGIAKAKAEGKYRGRKPKVRVQAEEIRRTGRDSVRLANSPDAGRPASAPDHQRRSALSVRRDRQARRNSRYTTADRGSRMSVRNHDTAATPFAFKDRENPGAAHRSKAPIIADTSAPQAAVAFAARI